MNDDVITTFKPSSPNQMFILLCKPKYNELKGPFTYLGNFRVN